MAAFEKRGRYWRVRIRRRGYPEQNRTFDNKARAEAWARAIEGEMDRGLYVDRTESEKNLLADIINRYLVEVTPTKRGAGPEATRLRALSARSIAQIKMAALSSAHIASYRDDRLKTVSSASINKELNHLAHVIETARREWGIQLPENPVRMVRRPVSARARDRRLKADEHRRLLTACDDARNPSLKPIVTLAIETAMRQGELVGLHWQHIDLRKRVAHLPLTKNGESRSVPLSKAAAAELRRLAKSSDGRGRVFPALTTEAIKRAFIRACSRAGLDDFHFHDLRHEATSRLFEKGLNPIEVASITGHKTLQMLKRYTHLRAEDLVRRLD
jgi:integrase